MIEVKDTSSRTRYVALTASPFVTVADIINFADKLRDQRIPPRERIDRLPL